MSSEAAEDRSIILVSSTGEKSIWRPREYIPPDDVWDTVAAAKILNAKTPQIEILEEPRKIKERKKQRWWRKWWEKMARPKRVQVLETGVDTFPTHRPTLLERAIDYWRPAQVSSPHKSFSPRLGFPSNQQIPKTRAVEAVVTTDRLPSKFQECREYLSGDPNRHVSHQKDTCKLPPSSSAATSLLGLGTLTGDGALNPLAGPSTQRVKFVHDRAKEMIAASEVPSSAASSKAKFKSRRRTERKKTHWSWLSCCMKSKNGCECDNQGQGNLGRMEGENLIRMNSEDSLVNITFGDRPDMSPISFEVAGDGDRTSLEPDKHKITLEVTDNNISRQHNMAKYKIEVTKAGSASSSSASPSAPAAPVLTRSTAHRARPESPDQDSKLSLAERLKAIKEKHASTLGASTLGDDLEDVWNSGGEGRVQGPAGTMRGESEVENGFVEVEVPDSNNTDPTTSDVLPCGSRARYLPAALEDAIKTELPKPRKKENARALGGSSDASSTGGSFKTARSTASTRSTASKITSLKSPTVKNSASTKQPAVSPVASPNRTRSVPSMPPTSTISKSINQATNKASTSSDPNDAGDPSCSLPINIKKPSTNYEMEKSYFKVRPQDGTDTGYPALDSSATSSDFGFHPTIVPGSWPDKEDSEWNDGKEEFEDVMLKKDDTSKNVKKR